MKNKIFILFLYFPIIFFAQETPPKVGLVLSGGGAKGLAHIGVLKEIEKAGIELDYIGGTSMGAIIGGLFAAGYTASELEEIALKTDFLTILQDINPRASKPFFEKENEGKYILSIPVVKGKIELPKGFSKGQNILNLLTELLTPVTEINNFSKLPIPFFCIATDASTGNQVVLEKGSLPMSLRASGSFPTLLNPIEIENQLLIDGGIANNFPADLMKTKGIDIVIGSDVQNPLLTKDKLISVNAILNQVVQYKMHEKSNKNKEFVDVYIKQNLENYSVLDFKKTKEILKVGHKTALKFKAIFQEISKKQKTKKRVISIKPRNKKHHIKEIIIDGLKRYTRAYVLGKLNIRLGDIVSEKEITKKVTTLSATQNYDIIQYSIKDKGEGTQLHFRLKESKQKTLLKFGLHYDLIYKTGILINLSRKNLFFKNDVFSGDIILGDNPRYNLNYFIDNGFYISFGFQSRYNDFRRDTKFDDILDSETTISKIDFTYKDFTNALFLQTTFNRKFALGIGAELKHLEISTQTLSDSNNEPITFEKSNFINPYAYLKLDTYNQKFLPTKGFFTDITFKWYAWSYKNTSLNNFLGLSPQFQPFTQLQGTLGFATPITNKFSFQLVTESGFNSNVTDDFSSFDFILGGYNQNYINTIVPFYGYDFADLVGSSFLKSEFHLRHEFLKNHYAVFIANYARVTENVLKDFDLFKDTKSGYALGYSLKTQLGPLELKYSWSPDNNRNYVLFNLGFWF